jgi:hypothetical protein
MILQVQILLYFKGIQPKKFQNQNGEIVTKNTQYWIERGFMSCDWNELLDIVRGEWEGRHVSCYVFARPL